MQTGQQKKEELVVIMSESQADTAIVFAKASFSTLRTKPFYDAMLDIDVIKEREVQSEAMQQDMLRQHEMHPVMFPSRRMLPRT